MGSLHIVQTTPTLIIQDSNITTVFLLSGVLGASVLTQNRKIYNYDQITEISEKLEALKGGRQYRLYLVLRDNTIVSLSGGEFESSGLGSIGQKAANYIGKPFSSY